MVQVDQDTQIGADGQRYPIGDPRLLLPPPAPDYVPDHTIRDVDIDPASKLNPALFADTGWVEPSLGVGWVNLGDPWAPARYRLRHGTLFLEGLLQNSTGGNLSTAFFVLPAGARVGKRSPVTAYGNPFEVRENGEVAPNLPVAAAGLIAITAVFCVA